MEKNDKTGRYPAEETGDIKLRRNFVPGEKLLRPAWAEIDLKALRHNAEEIKRVVGEGHRFFGVVKADAYGHGAVPVAKTLAECGFSGFATATLEEAIELRQAGIDEEILILGLTPSDLADEIVRWNLTPVIDSLAAAIALDGAAADQGKTQRAFIALDTGMGRIGYLTEDPDAIEEIKAMIRLDHFEPAGVISHFATADSPDKTFAKLQEGRYAAFLNRLAEAGIHLPTMTLANSAAIMDIPSVYYDAVRPGLILYGYYPYAEADRSILDLKPVMSVKARVVKVKTVPTGYSCGYGRKFIAQRESRIATLPVGYADGLSRAYSGAASVLINGCIAPAAGNICMDQFMIDVTDVPSVKPGDEVVILGSDGSRFISAETIAAACGLIVNEVLCNFGLRLPRVYLGLTD